MHFPNACEQQLASGFFPQESSTLQAAGDATVIRKDEYQVCSGDRRRERAEAAVADQGVPQGLKCLRENRFLCAETQ